MKKHYLLAGAVLFSAFAFAQNAGKVTVLSKKTFVKSVATDRVSSPDTTGIVNITDFLPEFAGGGQVVNYGYLGGGYIFGNNVDALNNCAQGYQNLNPTPVRVIGAIALFTAKERDGAGGATSKVVISAYDMADNKAYNTTGSGTFNQTVANHPGPNGAAKASADLLFTDIDTNFLAFNAVAFTNPPLFYNNFAIGMDASGLAAGDTVGLLGDDTGDANELDFTYHKIGSKWIVTDQAFSDPATGGTGALDCNTALFAIVNDATGVKEYFNGMKLTNYPNPAVSNTTIEYTLENNSKNVKLVVWDAKGRVVVENKYDSQNAGTYKINVETTNLTSGTYFYQLKANGHNLTKQLIVTK